MCLWLKHELQRHLYAHENSLSSGQPCHLLPGLYLTFSLPVYHNTKHNLDSTTFSKTTLYTEHFFQNLYGRQAAPMNRSRTSITRVAKTPRNTSPHSGGVKFLRRTIPPWIFTMDKWMRAQEVCGQRSRRQ